MSYRKMDNFSEKNEIYVVNFNDKNCLSVLI